MVKITKVRRFQRSDLWSRPSHLMSFALPLAWVGFLMIGYQVRGDEYFAFAFGFGPLLALVVLGPWLGLLMAFAIMLSVAVYWDVEKRPIKPLILTFALGALISWVLVLCFDVRKPDEVQWLGTVLSFYGSLLFFAIFPLRPRSKHWLRERRSKPIQFSKQPTEGSKTLSAPLAKFRRDPSDPK